MYLVAALQVGGALADDGLAADQGRLVGFFRGGDGGVDRVDIVTIDRTDHVPAVRLEALRRVVLKPAFHVAVNRDAVVVVHDDQLRQPQGASQRTGLM